MGYGYNFRVLSGTGTDQLWGLQTYPTNRIQNPTQTVMVCDAGHAEAEKFFNSDPVDWPPMYNNPAWGAVSFPGGVQWDAIPGEGTLNSVALARHIGGSVGCMFLDGHAQMVEVHDLLDPARGEGNCLYDAE